MLCSNFKIIALEGAPVPSHHKRTPARYAIALAIGLAFAAPAAYAAGLGRLTVQSALGQPLRAEVEVTSVAREEAGSLAVRLASQSAFRQANLEFNPALSALRFDLERRGENNFVVRISSLNPVNEPYLDLLLELTWATGRVLREYTVLLDPPALRAAPDVLAPVTTAQQPAAPSQVPAPAPATAPAPLAAAPEPAPVPTPAVTAPAPAPAALAAVPTAGTYTVKAGDTLGKIALRNKPANVSLDQMLVALFRANPNAFVANNMNRLLAGRTLTIPDATEAEAISTADARQEVAAHSADFAQYKSRLAQAASVAGPVAAAPAPAAAAQGRVTTKVEDKAAPAPAGDQLKIAKAEPAPGAAAAAATKAKDEEIARQRALKEQEERAAELKKANEALKKALELQSKAGAQIQKQAETKVAEAAPPTPAPQAAAPAPATTAAQPATAEPQKAEAPKAEAPKSEPPKAETPKVDTAKAETKKAPPAAAPAQETGFLEGLFRDTTTLAALGGLVALLLALLGLNVYRRRKVEKGEEFKATGEGMRANSLFGATGGRSVDTGATSTFNSSFIPAASQLDSNEVDPVAEADVYIAYGREEQAEDILKEALRLQPDRHAVRVKLLEIYARRGDKASFNAVAQELRDRTGGTGEDWDRAVKLGRSLDPSNPMFAGSAAEVSTRGPTTELRLNPTTKGPRPASLGGVVAPPATFGAVAAREPVAEAGGTPSQGSAPSMTSRFAPDTKMTADTAMQVDSRMTGDTAMTPSNTAQSEPDTRFEATLPLEEPAAPTKPAARAGTIDPFGATTAGAIDFGALDFDLGTTKAPQIPTPAPAPAPAAAMPSEKAPEKVPDLDFSFPPTSVASPQTTTAGARQAIPDVDLNLPSRAQPAPAFSQFVPPAAGAATSALEEALSRPTLLGDVGALPDEQAPRLTSNTDQATVPLIDFDLTGSDVEIGGRRTETQAGSPLAAQMATKLDLARGYIDLGVKDGARELLEEVMRDGTREQRQSAVELLKQVDV
jgi:pilus assembly protein FimV